MKTMLVAAATALGLVAGVAHANEHATAANPRPTQTTSAQNAGEVQAYVTRSERSTWLFAPAENGNG